MKKVDMDLRYLIDLWFTLLHEVDLCRHLLDLLHEVFAVSNNSRSELLELLDHALKINYREYLVDNTSVSVRVES